jgi:hypothetical protein
MDFTNFCLTQFESQIRHAVREGIVTKDQASLFDRRRASTDHRELQSPFQLCNGQTGSRAVLRTVLGFEPC